MMAFSAWPALPTEMVTCRRPGMVGSDKGRGGRSIAGLECTECTCNGERNKIVTGDMDMQ